MTTIPDTVWQKLAWWLPRRLAYWCAIRVGAHATTGKYGAVATPELLFTDALDRWDK